MHSGHEPRIDRVSLEERKEGMHQGVSFFLAGFPGLDRGEDGGFLPKGAGGRYYLFKFSTLT